MRTSKAFWIWGQFSLEDSKYLNELKNKVQSVLKSPEFETHITIAGPFITLDKSFLNKLEDFVKNNYKINLSLIDYDFKKDIYKSFYISINRSEKLTDLRNSIYKLTRFDLNEKYEPHISLAYGNHSNNEKLNLISELTKVKDSIKITKISLVDVNENINQWKILESFDLK